MDDEGEPGGGHGDDHDHNDHGDGHDHHGRDHGNDHAHDNGDGHDHHGHDHGDDHHAHDRSSVGVSVVTVSTSRSIDDDGSGDRIVELVEAEGHEVVTRELVNDDFDGVQQVVDRHAKRGDVDAIVTNGGTGVTPDDVTVEAVRPLLGKELPGFGELFRRLSYDEIGTKVVGTRAIAGVANGTLVFCLPGSENAVELGTAEVILPEVGHLAGLAARDDADEA